MLLSSSSSSSELDAIDVNRREVDTGSHCLHLDDASHLGCVIGNIGAQPATSAWRTALSIAMIAPRRSGHARSIAEIERYLRWQPCFAENTGLSMSAVAIRSVLNTGLQFFHFRYET